MVRVAGLKRRIATGAGVPVQEVNRMLNQFEQMQGMMKQMKKGGMAKMMRAMGGMMTELGVKPEIEAFDTGHLWFAKQLVSEGVLKPDALVQLCMGIPWGAPDDLNTFMAMVNNVPKDWNWSAFSIGRNQMAYVAASVLAGGNVRVGLEDNLWLDKGVLATNAQLVERAVSIISNLGARVITPAEVRAKLKLEKRAPLPR
jgi:uncharacterized protein (DUF849 family)